MTRSRWATLLLVAAVLWLTFLLLSLKTGWLNSFFFDTSHAPAPGIDFFSVQRGWVNLLAGKSEYDTFHSSYGPYATWLNYHPLLAVVVGPPLMLFSPWTAYGVWTGVSVLLMTVSGWVIAQCGNDSVRRACVLWLMVGSFPAFILWQSGNLQAVLVLAVTLVFAALHGLRHEADRRCYQVMLLTGLLMSLFSKPTVLAMLPLLLLLRETRRTTVVAVSVYLPVSFLSLVLPAWNPVALSWSERWNWLTHPDQIARSMNVYTNNFVVTRPMLDTMVHWFAMIGITDFRFLHVDIYSLSALLDGWLGMHTPDALYRVPILLVLEVSLLVSLLRDRSARMHAALLVCMAASLLLILSYGVVWEYHYTLVFPIAALLLVTESRDRVERGIVALGVLTWLPSLYIVMRSQDMSSLHVQTVLRAERVLPVLLIFLLLLGKAVAVALRHPGGLRMLTRPAPLEDTPQ